MIALEEMAERYQLLGPHQRPVVARCARERRRPSELGSAFPRVGLLPHLAETAACPGRGPVVLSESQRLHGIRFRGLVVSRRDGCGSTTFEYPRPQRRFTIRARLKRARIRQLRLRETPSGGPPRSKRRAETKCDRWLGAKGVVERSRQVGR